MITESEIYDVIWSTGAEYENSEKTLLKHVKIYLENHNSSIA